jgi:hypothetical protein
VSERLQENAGILYLRTNSAAAVKKAVGIGRSLDRPESLSYCDWKSDRERNDDKTHCGVRNLKKREELRRELRDEPRDYSIGDRCAVNIAPLQFGQDVLWIQTARLDDVTAAIVPRCA